MLKRTIPSASLSLLLIGLLSFALEFKLAQSEPRIWTVNDNGSADFQTIQEAVDAASSGDIVYVYNGTYYEHVTIGKALTLTGEDPYTTAIDGSGAQVVVVYVTADNVEISGFTIRNSGDDPPGNPWPLKSGICLYYANNITISRNIIESNNKGVFTCHSMDSLIYNNTISNNGYNLDLRYLSHSKIYYNNLVNDWLWQLYQWKTSDVMWHDGMGRGNYWSDYEGEDTDGDGVGDTLLPHQNVDHYPLMNPWTIPSTLVAKFAYSPLSPRVNEKVTFDASSSLPRLDETVTIPIVSYTWNFGDGTTITSANHVATHAYAVNDTYTVTLNITDSQGFWDFTSETLTVYAPHGPKAAFTCSFCYPRVNWMVTFDASTSLPGWNGTQESPIVNYEWSFGDDTSSFIETDPITTHTYTSEGNYIATLKATDQEGLLDTISKTIEVYPAPSSDLTAIGLRDVLELQMTLPRTAVVIGETISITVTLRNAGGKSIRLWFGSSQSFDVYLCHRGVPMAAWSYGKFFLMIVWDLHLDPGETYTVTLSWNFYMYDPSTGEYRPPSPGSYSLMGLCVGHFLDTAPAVITSQLPITLVEEDVLTVPAQYPTIQEAVNAAASGDTILVASGTYRECVVVNKTVFLVGEDKETTIIDGNKTFVTVLHITDNNVTIKGFTIQNDAAIYGFEGGGIYITNSSNNTITGNLIKNNQYGINLQNSTCNMIARNTLLGNDVGIQFLDQYSSNNKVYHNNFLDNGQQAASFNASNIWDNGCEGNYWSNYNGTDLNGDGVGDTYLPWHQADDFPLMNPYWSCADIDHNLKVDIKDIALVAKAFGSYPTHPNWNPHADITGPQYLTPDSKVDIRDIAVTAIDYGEKFCQ